MTKKRRRATRWLERWDESETLASQSDRLLADLRRMAPYADADFDHLEEAGLSPGNRMLLATYAIFTDMVRPESIRAHQATVSEWLEKGRDLFRRGMVPDPFGPERPMPTLVTDFPLHPEYERRGATIRLILACQHKDELPYRRNAMDLWKAHIGAKSRPWARNADLVLDELRFLYRDQLPFGVGLDDPPINPWSGKPSCQMPLAHLGIEPVGTDPMKGEWRKAWFGATQDF